jgi:hypothetical protein
MLIGRGRDCAIVRFTYHHASCRGLSDSQTHRLSQCPFIQVGKEVANRDIDECREMAKNSGATASQGKTGQVSGSTAAGGNRTYSRDSGRSDGRSSGVRRNGRSGQ